MRRIGHKFEERGKLAFNLKKEWLVTEPISKKKDNKYPSTSYSLFLLLLFLRDRGWVKNHERLIDSQWLDKV